MKTECREWEGGRWANGYGRIGDKRAHRVVWEEAHGPIPDGMMVLHHCDNPPCVELQHLYLGTHADNMRDRVVRDRGVRGERVNTAKLTVEQVHEIREHCDRGDLHREVATRFGVTQVMVGLIARRKSWSKLPERGTRPSDDEVATRKRDNQRAGIRRSWANLNPAERSSRGAVQRGSGNPSAKLTEAQVYEIRALVAAGQVQQRIADRFGVSQTVVSSIALRKTWRHLP